MNFLNHYYNNIITYNLINKFNHKTIKNLPALKSIILNFGCKSSDLKLLTNSLLALELITGKKGTITQAKNANILLKIRKGNPVGCKVQLKKNSMYIFLTKLIFEIFPKIKSLNYLLYKNNAKNTTAISYKISNTLIFPEFEKNYYLFNNLTNLQITFLTNTKTQSEFLYLLNSFKIPTKVK